MDTVVSFVVHGVYLLKSCPDIACVCLPCYNDSIGKLVQYKRDGSIFEKTSISYFLNFYFEGDIKEIFLNPENYTFLGKLYETFEFADGDKYLLRKKKDESKTVNSNDN